MMRELASGRPLSNPVLQGQGWWRRPGRFLCKPVATPTAVADIAVRSLARSTRVQPILITGATGTLGSAFARMCEQRNLAYHVLTRQEMDIADPASVEAAIVRFRPWAIINAGGYVRVDDAEHEAERCMRENTHGPTVLALACIRHALRFVTFSSDLVFDGAKGAPYLESDPAAPLNVYGRSKAEAERSVLDADPQALVIRSSAFFGPWDAHNFVTRSLNAVDAGQPFAAASDEVVTPTYVPDLVNATLDLLIDRERGIWHLSNGEPVSWADLARRACAAAGLDARGIEARPAGSFGQAAPRPGNSALGSERAMLLPPLDDALARYVQAMAARANDIDERGEVPNYANQ
jgi:dTDP-4-dehydrorhamnose reductase